ncbi:MAG TPA: nucleoside hydrolase [Candidatus Limnocylindrales bacterium]|nr:nucleoside hydrolase [Candidatus Limnocylindrales bacterium]
MTSSAAVPLRYDAREMKTLGGFLAAWLLVAAAPIGHANAQDGSADQPARGRADEGAHQDWPAYGGGPTQTHYSALAQINRGNVAGLRVAWEFDTGESGGLETTPLIVNGVLYGITPTQKIFALDAATGKQLWKFDSGVQGTQPDRGLAYWSSGGDKRILVAVMNYLYALDPATGKPVASFGVRGRIDLREGLGRDPKSVWTPLTTPGIVYKDLIIVGGRNPETLPAPPGDIRAYDVRTGKLRWSFHTIPRPGEFGYDTWPKDAWKYEGAANNWAGMALDAERGIVYVPTGSAAFDFYGANRAGDDLFANCLIALDAETGRRLWHFQGVRHDLWDRDFPAPPALVTVERDGKKVDAVAQTTKQGYVYLFDRATGTPLFPIEYHKVPASRVPGEVAAAEQPLPTKPAPFARQMLTADMLTERTPAAHAWAEEQFRKFRSEGQFVPFGVGVDTVVFPGFDGGAEWGGPAVDPETGILYVNANEMAWTGALAPNTGKNSPRGIYLSQCSVCHGERLKGSAGIPSLVNVGARLTTQQIEKMIRNGKGRMTGFPNLSEAQVAALTDFLTSGESKAMSGGLPEPPRMNYRFTGYRRFVEPDGYPAISPPWGTLSAINLNTGEFEWKVNLGEFPELAARGVADTGSENYGGPIVTAGGLVFIGATDFDRKFRAFDKTTGKLLWETTLPFAGNATPATYEANGRQFVVIAAGGGKDPKSATGGVYVAFALPNEVGAAGGTADDPPATIEASAGGKAEAASETDAKGSAEKIIIDTDIGDDIDDAFALALALRGPELQILGVTTTFGDTEARAKIADRMLGEDGREDIPVAVGEPTPQKSILTQRAYGEGGHFARKSHPKATDFILEQIRRHPGQITLVAIGPLMNVGAVIDKDPDTFRKLKRVVMMGGSVERGYGDPYAPPTPPQPEWNILNDVASAQKLFASGVPIYMMPLDSTQLKLDEVKRAFLFRQGKPLTDALTLLYHEWGQETPTLFDPMTIAFILRPELCPVKPMDIRVDEKGMTLAVAGAANAEVCLHSDPESFFQFYLARLTAP